MSTKLIKHGITNPRLPTTQTRKEKTQKPKHQPLHPIKISTIPLSRVQATSNKGGLKSENPVFVYPL